MEIKEKIQKLIKENDVCLFMKGTPDSPQCGFSMTVSNVLKHFERRFFIPSLCDESHLSIFFETNLNFDNWMKNGNWLLSA